MTGYIVDGETLIFNGCDSVTFACIFSGANNLQKTSAAVMELALTYKASEAATLGMSYGTQLGARASDQSVKGHVEVRF